MQLCRHHRNESDTRPAKQLQKRRDPAGILYITEKQREGGHEQGAQVLEVDLADRFVGQEDANADATEATCWGGGMDSALLGYNFVAEAGSVEVGRTLYEGCAHCGQDVGHGSGFAMYTCRHMYHESCRKGAGPLTLPDWECPACFMAGEGFAGAAGGNICGTHREAVCDIYCVSARTTTAAAPT